MQISFKKMNTKQKILLITGLVFMLTGIGILSFLGIRKIRRDLHRRELMKQNAVIEIPDLDIRAPILEGTEQSVLAEAAGHFTGTGEIGKGNYCIAAHSSPIYKEYFNNLKYAEKGMQINLYDHTEAHASYTVADSFYVEPNETWILDDFGDCRVTLVTCNDDGSQRLIVVAKAES